MGELLKIFRNSKVLEKGRFKWLIIIFFIIWFFLSCFIVFMALIPSTEVPFIGKIDFNIVETVIPIINTFWPILFGLFILAITGSGIKNLKLLERKTRDVYELLKKNKTKIKEKGFEIVRYLGPKEDKDYVTLLKSEKSDGNKGVRIGISTDLQDWIYVNIRGNEDEVDNFYKSVKDKENRIYIKKESGRVFKEKGIKILDKEVKEIVDIIINDYLPDLNKYCSSKDK